MGYDELISYLSHLNSFQPQTTLTQTRQLQNLEADDEGITKPYSMECLSLLHEIDMPQKSGYIHADGNKSMWMGDYFLFRMFTRGFFFYLWQLN